MSALLPYAEVANIEPGVSKDHQCFTKCATLFEWMAYRALRVGASRMLIDEECVRASPASLSATRASPFMIGSGATARSDNLASR